MIQRLTLPVVLCLICLPLSASELNGAWRLVSGEYINENGERIDYIESGMASIKVLSDRHFSFTSEKGGRFWASGTGTYHWEQGVYTESLLYNSFGQTPGTEFQFKARLEGDRWYNSRWQDDKRVEFEVWQRIDPCDSSD